MKPILFEDSDDENNNNGVKRMKRAYEGDKMYSLQAVITNKPGGEDKKIDKFLQGGSMYEAYVLRFVKE